MGRKTGSRHLAETLRDHEVSHVFLVPAVLMQALAEMERAGIVRIVAHSEKAAAYMADGYARASGKPGLCMAQNIGASNLAAGLRDARMACAPIIAMTGGPIPMARYRNQYQEIEDISQFDAVTKFNACIDDVRRLPDLLQQAFREATTGAPGPTHLRLRGFLGELTEETADFPESKPSVFARAPAFRAPAPSSQIETVARALQRAQRPMIVAGGGVVWSGAGGELRALAEALDIPVATSLNGKGVIHDTHRLSVGVVGTYSRDSANKALAAADLVFFVGSRTGSQVTTNWSIPGMDATVVHLDIEAKEIGRNYPDSIPLVGDAKTALAQLRDHMRGAKPSPMAGAWLTEIRQLATEWRTRENLAMTADRVPIRPERLCRAISRVLPKDGVVVSDTGHSGMWSGAMIDFEHADQRYLRCAGSLGWSFPAAIGVKCALPDRQVICFNGDGAFYYHLPELETAARHGINVVVVVNNNSAFNQEVHLVDDAYKNLPDERSGDLWKFRDVNFADVAESFGCFGVRVTAPTEIEDALRKAMNAGRPAVVDVVTDVGAMARHAWKPPARPGPL